MSNKLNTKEVKLAQGVFKALKVTKVLETPDEVIIYLDVKKPYKKDVKFVINE